MNDSRLLNLLHHHDAAERISHPKDFSPHCQARERSHLHSREHMCINTCAYRRVHICRSAFLLRQSHSREHMCMDICA